MLTKEITNEREYRTARSEVEQLVARVAEQDYDTEGLPPRLRDAMHGATESRLEELRLRVHEYERYHPLSAS